jgi:phytanoyl-CoA hydroxylase
MSCDRYTSELAEHGYFMVRQGFNTRDIEEMRARLEDIVQGKYFKDGRRFQADTESGRYEDMEKTEMGYRGPNAAYRKIADLEYDDVFLEKLQSSWIRDICEIVLGPVTSIMRVTMMDKPARGGTPLPWHQDVSLDWPTQVQPKLAIWFSLDKATAASGSLQVIPGSHRHEVIRRGHLLPVELESKYAPESQVLTIDAHPGDVLFFSAALLHRSGINVSDAPRRAVNAILIPGPAIHTRRNKPYPILYGAGEMRPVEVARLTAIPN